MCRQQQRQPPLTPLKRCNTSIDGSPLHICHTREQLENYTPLKHPFYVTFGTQGRATAEGVGTIRLPVTTGDGILRLVTIHKVYYVPNFIVNIISARSLMLRWMVAASGR
jgi:hypothetical protein